MVPRLSVVMIVRNEASVLADCLASVRAIADEIVVGDTGSTDTTKQIAIRAGAEVLDVPWRDDFAWARNQVLAQAAGDWLLHMDADEVLGSAELVRAIVDRDGAGADAIEVTLANYCDTPYAWRWVPAPSGGEFSRGYSGYIAAPLLRLFRNGRGFEYREAVHENITESVVERGGTIAHSTIVIHHYGYASPTAPEKAQRYYALAKKKVVDRPDDAKAWHDLAEQSLACGESGDAENACRRALALDAGHVGALSTLAMLLLNRGDIRDAVTLLEAVPERPPHLDMALGAAYERRSRLTEAHDLLQRVVDHNPGMVVARLYLARVLDRLGLQGDAADQLGEALRIAPQWQDAMQRHDAHRLRGEGEAIFASGDHEMALKRLIEAMRNDPEDPILQNDLGVVLHAMRQFDASRQAFERALRLAPDMPEALENLAALP